MSERLVASTTTGWRKYKTDSGKEKYRRPNGQYASPSQYNGSLSHAEEIDETEDIGVTPPIRDYEYNERDDLESYEKAVDYDFPVNKEICGGLFSGIDWEYQFHRLWNQMEILKDSYHEYSFGIEYVIFDESGNVIGKSEKHTTSKPYEKLKPQSELSFYRFGEVIERLCDSYTQVLVKYVRIKARSMKEEWR